MSTIYGAISDRETATMLAALRHWQEHKYHSAATFTIASNDGEFEPLTDSEIDALCETVNTVDLVWKEGAGAEVYDA